MDIINPNEIGTKISTLIAESDEKFYAITPYIDLSKWKKMIINIEKAIKRGVSIKLFYREIKQDDLKILTKLGVELIQIKGLHTKLYFNEKSVIVSSMNLYESSDLYSIDIALYFEEKKEYNKIYTYFKKYISPEKKKSEVLDNSAELDELHGFLSNKFYESRINKSKTYLFSDDLHPYFDVFIESSKIGFKIPDRNPSSILVNKIDKKFKEEICKELKLRKYETTPGNIYCIWEMEIKQNMFTDSLKLIKKIQKLRSKSSYSNKFHKKRITNRLD